ncbi:MAG: hypothetical protein ACTS3R_00350 [Inquilinaceae bacterium]
MADTITYSVLVREGGTWHSKGTVDDMSVAMQAAEQFLESGKFGQVKVDKTFLDKANNRNVTATILDRSVGSKSGMPVILLLILLAILGGGAAFAITYLATQYL